jgi:hypothetical protein
MSSTRPPPPRGSGLCSAGRSGAYYPGPVIAAPGIFTRRGLRPLPLPRWRSAAPSRQRAPCGRIRGQPARPRPPGARAAPAATGSWSARVLSSAPGDRRSVLLILPGQGFAARVSLPLRELADSANVTLGHKSVQRWKLPDGWVISRRPGSNPGASAPLFASRRVQTSSCAARSSSTMRTILPRVCPSLTLRCARAAFRQKYLLDT